MRLVCHSDEYLKPLYVNRLSVLDSSVGNTVMNLQNVINLVSAHSVKIIFLLDLNVTTGKNTSLRGLLPNIEVHMLIVFPHSASQTIFGITKIITNQGVGWGVIIYFTLIDL